MDLSTLQEVLESLYNWFEHGEPIEGEFTVSGNAIEIEGLASGQFYRIEGSVFNDGLHAYSKDFPLVDEVFEGTVQPLAVPKAVQDIAAEVSEYKSKNPAGPYVSESFGGYSYTKASNSSTGTAASWEDVFRSRLSKWRKLPLC